jgi:2-keto-3-deoxy-L-rhamnonate aldolase RhmA
MTFKEDIKKKRQFGYWSIIPSVQIHEIMAFAGFNFCIIDLEHGTYSFQEALESVISIQSSGMRALIRPSSHDEKEILRCLEIGVDGICIPHVRNKIEAEKIISACTYPPSGNRGASGFTRASNYGLKNFSDHVKTQNKDLFISLLIESEEGLKNINDIASLSRLDGLYFGTYDIASSLGYLDQNSTDVTKLINGIIDSIDNENIIFGQVFVNNEQFINLNENMNFVVAGVDCGIFLHGANKARSGFS